jgi:hypothetical protein
MQWPGEAACSETREPGWYPVLCREHAKQTLNDLAPRGRPLSDRRGDGDEAAVGALRGA